jgi:hypothetical protein
MRTSSTKDFLKSQDRRDAFYKREMEAWKGLPSHIQDHVPPPMKPKDVMLNNGHVDAVLYGLLPGIKDITRAEALRNNFLMQNREKHWRTQKLEASVLAQERMRSKRREMRQNHIAAGIAGEFPHKTMSAEHVTNTHVNFQTHRHDTQYLKNLQALIEKRHQHQEPGERVHVPRVEILSDDAAGDDDCVRDDEGSRQKKRTRHQVFEDGFVLFTDADDDGDGVPVGEENPFQHDDNTNSSPIGGGGDAFFMAADDDTTRPARSMASSFSSSHDLLSSRPLQQQQRIALTGTKKKKKTVDRRTAAALVDDMLDDDDD